MLASPRLRPLLFALLGLTLALTGCGDDEPRPIMQTKELASTPEGEPIPEAAPLADGFRWKGTITTQSENKMSTSASDAGPSSVSSGSATIEFDQTHRAGNRPHVTFSARFVEIVNQSGPAPQLLGSCTGTMPLGSDGRPQTGRVTIEGKYAKQVQNLINTMVVPTVFGSHTWLPREPVRVGEAWEAKSFVDWPRLRGSLNLDANPAVKYPEPNLSGACRLERIEKTDTGEKLVLRLDMLVEANGMASNGRDKAPTQYGYRVRGIVKLDGKTRLLTDAAVTTEVGIRMTTNKIVSSNDFVVELQVTAGPAD